MLLAHSSKRDETKKQKAIYSKREEERERERETS